MNKKILFVGLSLLASSSLFAQDIYQMEKFSSNDLNGTARYVGMGGAMSALGADLSVMGANPAGIGLYRKSDIATSLSVVSQEDGVKFDGKSKTHASFDNLGFVYAINLGEESACHFINLGFGYHKQKDFNNLFNVGTSPMGGASQTWQMASLAKWDNSLEATPLTYMGNEVFLIQGGHNDVLAHGASATSYQKAEWGSNQSYDFNISANINERVYLGLTLALSNINYKSYSVYGEDLINNSMLPIGNYSLMNNRKLSGHGVNLKFGAIVRPIEESPFRIGVAVTTPTRLDMRMDTYSSIYSTSALFTDGIVFYDDEGSPYTMQPPYDCDGEIVDYHYNIHTPWKFNFSLGNTFLNCLAVGLEYEYSDYSTAKVAYDDINVGWDFDDETDDHMLNDQADRFLKGVHTIKAGLEWMVDPSFALRFGYNHVTSPFAGGAYANQFIDSASIDYSTSTNYANMGAINRWCVGLGYSTGDFYVDAAFQYQHQHAHYSPFNIPQDYFQLKENYAPCSKVNLSRSQFMLTLGYRF